MVDVGDDDEYSDSDVLSDFGGEDKYYETFNMGDLRRLAGLEQLAEEEVAEEEVAEEEVDEEKEEAVDEEKEEVNESEPHNTGDYSAFDFANEQAYYLVSDEIGDRVQFGDHDEVLVPDALADGILVLLAKNGFEKGQDFSVAGMDEDLQNGYNNRNFIDGQDLFPRGANNQPADDLGPTASGFGDNAMKNRMRSKDVAEVYESMKLSYRRFRKS